MRYVGYYFIVLFIIFLIMYIGSYILRKKKNKLGGSAGFRFIEKRYNLNMDEKRANALAKILVFNDSFLLSVPIYMCLFVLDMSSVARMIILFAITFVFCVVFVLLSYNMIGKILKKKGW